MGRPKKQLKIKEPIRLRERKLANGNIGLYLDIYIKGTRKYESLGLYLIPERTPEAKRMNAHTRQVAEKIKSERIISLQDRGIKKYDEIKKSSIAFIDYLKEYEQDSFGFAKSTLKGRQDMRKKVEEYLNQEKIAYISLRQIDADFCRGFLRFLATAKHGICKYKVRTINQGCAHHHQAVLNGALNRAVRQGLLMANPMKQLDRREKFQPGHQEREYLTIAELRALMQAPCTNEEVKRAFLFSCFTGLRLSDIRSLTWRNIKDNPDGNGMYIQTIMQKTQKPVSVPLSNEAMKYMQDRKDYDAPIFNIPISDATINYHIKKWLKAASIDKHISFHCSRHTFATTMLTLGADIYTTSKLLGHSNVTTTAIYAKIIDKKKIEAVNLIDNLFERNEQRSEN